MAFSVVPDEVAERMAQRVDVAQGAGEYIGLFEFIAWGVMQSSAVHVLFGNHVVDIMAVFAPQFAVPSPLFITRAAGVFLADTKWRAVKTVDGAFPKINHFVWGVPIHGSAVHASSGLDAWKKPGVANCAIAAGMEAGWFLKPTTALGDCGIDVMAASANLERSPESWQQIRISHIFLGHIFPRQEVFIGVLLSLLQGASPFTVRTFPVSSPGLPGQFRNGEHLSPHLLAHLPASIQFSLPQNFHVIEPAFANRAPAYFFPRTFSTKRLLLSVVWQGCF